MTTILAPGASAVLVGVDANGLATTQFPGAPSWSVSDGEMFTVVAAADGLSATITPTGKGGTTTLSVVAGTLSASVDISFDAVVVPPTPGVAVTMSIQLTQLPAPAPAA